MPIATKDLPRALLALRRVLPAAALFAAGLALGSTALADTLGSTALADNLDALAKRARIVAGLDASWEATDVSEMSYGALVRFERRRNSGSILFEYRADDRSVHVISKDMGDPDGFPPASDPADDVTADPHRGVYSDYAQTPS